MSEKLPSLPESDGDIPGETGVEYAWNTDSVRAYALRAIRESEAVRLLRLIVDADPLDMNGFIAAAQDYLASLEQK